MPNGGIALCRIAGLYWFPGGVNYNLRLEAGINGLPGFSAVVGCSHSPGLGRCAVVNSSEPTFDAFYIDAHAALTDNQIPVFTSIGRSNDPSVGSGHHNTIQLCHFP